MMQRLKNIKNLGRFQHALLNWFAVNKRLLPWRENVTWYKIFLSEFLLQQTQVSQALPYFENIFRTYPTIHHLAAASEEELLALWSGLGYYTRARNLRKAAQTIVNHFKGLFPKNYEQALSLPGIGPYTAAAILSINFNQPFPVVDGNTIRVIARLFNVQEDVRKGSVLKEIRNLSQFLLSKEQPGLFNEALMELGALICQPINPRCIHCPLQPWCQAYQNQSYDRIPFKSKPKAKKKQFQIVFLFVNEGKILLGKRPPNAMLASLWEFPVYQVEHSKLLAKSFIQNFNPLNFDLPPVSTVLPKMKHIYSHIALQYRPLIFIVQKSFRFPSKFYLRQRWFALPELSSLALHNAHKKILQSKAFKNWWQEIKKKEKR